MNKKMYEVYSILIYIFACQCWLFSCKSMSIAILCKFIFTFKCRNHNHHHPDLLPCLRCRTCCWQYWSRTNYHNFFLLERFSLFDIEMKLSPITNLHMGLLKIRQKKCVYSYSLIIWIKIIKKSDKRFNWSQKAYSIT